MSMAVTKSATLPAANDRRHLPPDEAIELEIRDAVNVAARLSALMTDYPGTRERLELPRYLGDADQHAQQAARGLALLNEIDRPATSLEISQHLTLLLGSLAGSKADPKTFAKMLKVDVVAHRPSIGALEVAFRTLRRTKTFQPSIAEVLEALGVASKLLSTARFHLERFPATLVRARERAERDRLIDEEDRRRRRARIREDIAERRSLWAHHPDEVAEVNAEMVAEGLPGIQGDW